MVESNYRQSPLHEGEGCSDMVREGCSGMVCVSQSVSQSASQRTGKQLGKLGRQYDRLSRREGGREGGRASINQSINRCHHHHHHHHHPNTHRTDELNTSLCCHVAPATYLPTSLRASLAPSSPATSSHLTFGFSETIDEDRLPAAATASKDDEDAVQQSASL